MVKTNRNSKFVLYSLNDIRSTVKVILQMEDTGTKFEDGHKCYLCEVVDSVIYHTQRTDADLIKEICILNNEKRKLERKIVKLEKKLRE